MSVEQQARDSFYQWWKKAEEKFPQITDLEYPELRIVPAKELKKISGTAQLRYPRDPLIKLNAYFLETETENMLGQTIPHEIAHIVTRYVYPRAKQSHGPEWKSVMRTLGVDPVLYHSYDINGLYQTGVIKTKLKKRFNYITEGCNCEFWLSTVLHNRVTKWQRRYCRPHKNYIHFTGEVKEIV